MRSTKTANRKRAASAKWKAGDRARAALGETSPTNVNLPPLPLDCWRIIMELALGQRTLAKFGPSGAVVSARDYYGNVACGDFASIRVLRLVSRAWNAAASQLVRAIRLGPRPMKEIHDFSPIADLFPNAARIFYHYRRVQDEQPMKELGERLVAHWKLRHPESLRTVPITTIPDEFTEGIIERRVFHTRNDGTETHGFIHIMETSAVLSDADAWCIFNMDEMCDMLCRTIEANPEYRPPKRIPIYIRCVRDDRPYSNTICSEQLPALAALTAHIDLHIFTYYKLNDSTIQTLRQHFPGVIIHACRETISSFAIYQPNVRADADEYQKLWEIGATVPLIG